MPFPAARVGLGLKPTQIDLSPRLLLAYAAGLGASEADFLDDAREGGLLALPFLCVRPEWPTVLSLRSLLGDQLTVDEARGAVHAVQDSYFHRPMRPGDQLVTEGRLVSVTQIRSGVLTACRLETLDRRTSEPVTTTWTQSVYRNVLLDGEPVVLEAPPTLSETEAMTPGHNAVETVIQIPREMPHVYSECADIWNPIHTEREVALAAGLPDIILHGTATWALAGLTLLRQVAGGDATRLKRLSGRFTGMVIPGDRITVRHEVMKEAGVRFEVRTSSGALAISQGLAWF